MQGRVLEAKFNEKHHFILRDDYDYALKLFLDGANEQKAIDIEKACEWLFVNIGHYVNEQGFVETHELENDFRKAMEE